MCVVVYDFFVSFISLWYESVGHLYQFPVQETEGGTSFVSEVNSTPIPSAPSLPLESNSLEPDEVGSSHLSLPFIVPACSGKPILTKTLQYCIFMFQIEAHILVLKERHVVAFIFATA